MVTNTFKVQQRGCSYQIETNRPVLQPGQLMFKPRHGDKIDFVGRELNQTDKQRRAIISRVIEYCYRHDFWIDYYPGCAERGCYDDKPIICADWNPDKMSRLYDFLDQRFDDLVQVDWSDEYVGCDECGRAVRTVPDCYSWQPSYIWASDCEIVCHECAQDCIEDIIEYYKNTTDRAVLHWVIPLLESEGFICLTDYFNENACQRFETGWYPGQNDSPVEVIKNLKAELGVDWLTDKFDYIFAITATGQFDVHWALYLREL